MIQELIMDIKLMLTTFGLVFLAELGDKTQLATFCLSADCGSSKLTVFMGSASALVLSSFIAVVLGDTVARFVSPHYIKLGAGLFFIMVGIYTLFTAYKGVCSL
jgi:Ca2+/H+ antiporter, TMEM165/GDT1 family